MEVSKSGKPFGEQVMKGVRAITGGKGRRRRHEKKGRADVTQGPEIGSAKEDAEMRLAMTVGNIQNHFVANDGYGVRFLDENDPRSAAFIEDVLFTDVWRNDATADKDAWSAATTSAHIRSYLGAETNEEAKEMGFRPFAAHRRWINDSFATRRDKDEKDTEYDAYRAERLLGRKASQLEVGDMVFRGYNSNNDSRDIKQTKDWSFNQFKRAGLEMHDTGENIQYNSHTDVIVGAGVDANGKKYYDIAGGNVDNEYMVKRFYVNELRKEYRGALVQNKSTKPKG